MSYHLYEYVTSIYIYSNEDVVHDDYVIDIGAYSYRKLIWKYEKHHSMLNNLQIRRCCYVGRDAFGRDLFRFDEVFGIERMLMFK